MKIAKFLTAALVGVTVLSGQVYGASVKEKIHADLAGPAGDVGLGTSTFKRGGIVFIEGIPVRMDQDTDFGVTTGVHFYDAGKAFFDTLKAKFFGRVVVARHEGDHGHEVVTTKLADVVIITTSCFTSTENVKGSSIKTTIHETKGTETSSVIEQPSTTEVKHTVPANDVYVVPSTTAVEIYPSATETPVVVPPFTDVYTPITERTIITATEQSTKIIATCPVGGCVPGNPGTPLFEVPTVTDTPSSAPEAPASLITKTTSHLVTSYTTESDITTASETTIPGTTIETPQSTLSQGVGAQVLLDGLYKVVVAIVAVHIGY